MANMNLLQDFWTPGDIENIDERGIVLDSWAEFHSPEQASLVTSRINRHLEENPKWEESILYYWWMEDLQEEEREDILALLRKQFGRDIHSDYE